VANQSDLRELADTAYDSKNYQQAYEYYSRMLEADVNDASAWIMKGLSAGFLSESDSHRLDEVEVCINKSIDHLDAAGKERVADGLMSVGQHVIDETYGAFAETMSEYDKKSMSTGELRAVRNVGKQTEGLYRGGELNEQWYRALQLMDRACKISPSKERFEHVIEEIDHLKAHSNGNGNYLDLGEDEMVNREGNSYEDKLNRLRRSLLKRARAADSSFQPKQVDTSSGGCFIATAALGDVHHPDVVALKKFRDEVLLPTTLGTVFVRTYYQISPPVARWIGQHSRMQRLTRRFVVQPLRQLTDRIMPSDC